MIRLRLGILILFFLSFSPLCSAQRLQIPATEKHPEFAEKIHIDGVSDAGKLNAHLYRVVRSPQEKDFAPCTNSASPPSWIFAENFDHESSNEKKEAESRGMKFVLIPGNGWSPPTDK